VEQQVIARNPADVLARHLPKVERRKMMTLTAEQAARLLEAIKRNRVYWTVLIALSTGMRRGEILALRWKNIDLDRGLLRVVRRLGPSRSRASSSRNYAVSSGSKPRNCWQSAFGSRARRWPAVGPMASPCHPGALRTSSPRSQAT